MDRHETDGPLSMDECEVSINEKKMKDVGPCPLVSVATSPRKNLLQTKGIKDPIVEDTIHSAHFPSFIRTVPFYRPSALLAAERFGDGAGSVGLEIVPYQTTEAMSTLADPIPSMESYLPDLPVEVWSVILLKAELPVKSLLNLTTNSLWNLAIKNPWFVREYDKRGGTTDSLLVQEANRSDFTIYSLRTNTRDMRLEFPRGILDHFDIIGSCKGLLCMTVLSEFRAPIYFWNASIRMVRQLPLLPLGHNEEAETLDVAFGLGFKIETEDYQLVRIVPLTLDDVENPVYKVQIFSLNSGTWSTMDLILGNDRPIHFWSFYGVYWNECLHWALEYKSTKEILCYHIEKGSFEVLPPLPKLDRISSWFTGVCNNLLGLLLRRDYVSHSVCDVYTLIGNEKWIKFYSIVGVSRPQLVLARPLSHTRHGYNTGCLNEKTNEFYFSIFVGSDEEPAVEERISDIVVMPGADLQIFVDRYQETLQLLL